MRCFLGLAALAAATLQARAELTLSVAYSGVAKSANTGDFEPNACGYEEFSNQFISAAESRFAYVSASFFGNSSVCGRCANVSLSAQDDPSSSTPNTTVTVMLISHFEDECGKDSSGEDDSSDESSDSDDEGRSCKYDLMLSEQAYRDMLNQGSGSRYSVDWMLVECPSDFVDGGVEFVFDDATTAQLLTVQPRNFHGAIESLEVKFEDGATYEFGGPGESGLGSFRQVILTDGKHNFTEQFTLVATQAQTLDTISVDVTEQPVANEVLVTDAQFDAQF